MGKKLILNGEKHTITNPDIAEESLELFESLCSSKSLQFGSCEASRIKLRVRANESLINEKFSVMIEEGSISHQIGVFIVRKDTPTADRYYRDIEASDFMRDIINKNAIKWYNELQFPMTMKNFRDSFFVYMGIDQEDVTLVNDSMIVEKTVDSTYLSGKQIMNAVCELNGCFGHINENGVFTYIYLVTGNGSEVEKYEAPCKYEDFNTRKITKITIRESEGDIGASYGTNGNDYVIEDNFICFGKSNEELLTVARNIFSVVKDITYKPYTVNTQIDYTKKIGERITINTSESTICSYILERVTKGIQFQKSSISANGTERFMQHVNGIAYDIIQLKGKSNILERNLEETKSNINDIEQGLSSRIEQNASSISTEITRAKDAENVLNTKIGQTDEKISVEVSRLQKEIDGDIKTYNIPYVPTLYNYPAWDFTYNIPCNNTVKLSDELEFEYTEEYYSKNARTIAFNEITFVSYRFMKDEESGKWHWREVADSEYGYVLQQISMLQIEADNISSTVQENKTYSDGQFENLSSKITQNASSITSEVKRATSAEGELSSKITQTAESINSKVSKGSIISEINQTAETITIKASKIDLVGLVNATEFTSKYATIESLNAESARIGNLEADHVSISSLNAVSGRVGSLEADHVSVESMNAVSAKVSNLEADHVSVSSFNAMNATVSKKLTTSELSATISDLSIVVVKMLQIGNKRVGSTQMNGHTVLTWE